ncbi:ribonuclease HII [Desulfurococcaceae archaeon MEX13E-LK6-19]|nr:ribonuclease HII [Desulfurococcaceae archaeon MEX13E-LK6-19]
MGENLSCVIGIDEAGRGPLLGDMVIACVVVSKENLEKMVRIGVKDSKNLTPLERATLLKHIIENSLIILTTYVNPYEIDEYNLNELTLKKIKEMLSGISRLLPENTRIERITVDMVKGYQKFIPVLESIFPEAKIMFVEKADVYYPEVSAASIVAKVYRDVNLYSFKKIYGDFGSGYPTDPKTISWLKTLYLQQDSPPPILRRTWGILERITPHWYVKKRKQRTKPENRSILDFI